MSRAFFDVEIGDPKERAALIDAADRGVHFLRKRCHELGITAAAVKELTLEEKELLSELYDSDPTCKVQGSISFEPVPPAKGGRLVFSLSTTTPKTSANFLALCTGSRGSCKSDKRKPLHYKSIPIHRIVKGFVAQGGDITRMDGSGGESIYGGKFNDEKEGMNAKFEKGILAMANSGKNSNTSQFFVVLTDDKAKLAKMDGKYVVFGKVVEGLDVLEALDAVGSEDGKPAVPVVIRGCGELP
ncbi:hypothetical protein HDV00_005987 [Rhizophlyctis rosea]|nr:hypothetical protein HDV00_005987 [Rhizophlyctis rosea]